MDRKSHKGRAPRPVMERVMESVIVDPDTECWVWQKSANAAGYGGIWVGSRADGTRRRALAHRAAYEYSVGRIPDGHDLDHLCRNPACVNPDHLEPVTRLENLMRGDTPAARNAAKTHCPKGHEYSMENTSTHRGKRYCRTCHRHAQAEAVRRMRAGKSGQGN